MRKVSVLLVACLVLAGCSSWEGEVRFTVTRIAPPYESVGKMRPARVIMELDQEAPKSSGIGKTSGADIDQFPADVKVGDKVLCTVSKVEDNGLDDVDAKTTIGPCKRA